MQDKRAVWYLMVQGKEHRKSMLQAEVNKLLMELGKGDATFN